MPKKIYEISSFDYGIVANPNDELDIPDNAASYSLNIEPLTSGELKGIPKSTFLKKSGFVQHFKMVSYNRPSSRSLSEKQKQQNHANEHENQEQ